MRPGRSAFMRFGPGPWLWSLTSWWHGIFQMFLPSRWDHVSYTQVPFLWLDELNSLRQFMISFTTINTIVVVFSCWLKKGHGVQCRRSFSPKPFGFSCFSLHEDLSWRNFVRVKHVKKRTVDEIRQVKRMESISDVVQCWKVFQYCSQAEVVFGGLKLFKTCQNSERDARKASIAVHSLPAVSFFLVLMFPTHASCFKGCKIASGDQPTRLVAPASLTQWFPVVFGAQMAVLAAAEALGWFLIGPFLESA